VVWALTY